MAISPKPTSGPNNFGLARHAPRIETKRRDHFLLTDFSLLILIATWSSSGLRSIWTNELAPEFVGSN